MDGGADTSGAGPGATPHCVWLMAGRAWWQFSLREGGMAGYREITAGWLISYQGNQQRGTALTAPLSTPTSWGLGHVLGRSAV